MANVPAVLIVDENDDNRIELRKLLTRAGLVVSGEARFGASAAVAANESRPDAIVVGIEEPPNRALETIEALSHLLLDTPIIACSSLDEAGAVRRATRAGVRDYLVRPVDSAALGEAITGVLAQERRRALRRSGAASPPVRGSVITVSGAKGGVGKSVVAINLAVALRQVTGRTVALVDCDTHFGDVAMMLNLPAEPAVTETIAIADELDRASVLEHTVPHSSGIRILPGPRQPEDWELVQPGDLDRLISLLAEAFDFVVIDTPDVFDHLVERCVVDSTLIFLVTSMDLSSIANTKTALRLLHRWDCPPENVRLVANSLRRRDSLDLRHVTQALNWPVFWAVPFDKYVPDAAQLGKSVTESVPKAAFSRSFRELAGAVSGTGKGDIKDATATGRRGLIGRLLNPATAE
jgi:pilus assembly protein CpaE